jgi:hypothetical protein
MTVTSIPASGSPELAPAVLGLNEVLVLDALVTPDEQSVLASWAVARHRTGALLDNPIDPRRHLTPYLAAQDHGPTPLTRRRTSEDGDAVPVWIPEVTPGRVETPPDEFWQIRQRVIDQLGLNGARDDPYKGSFLTYVTSGGFVHEHRDARLDVDGETAPLLRCNILLTRPARGGLPVINDQEIEVPDRGMWAFYPTELLHSATQVSGPTGRVTLSFGFVIDPRTVWERPFRIRPDLASALVADLRQELRTTAIGAARAATLDLLLTRPATFRIREIVDLLSHDPWAVWQEVHLLQKMEVIESLSPPVAKDGQLLVM